MIGNKRFINADDYCLSENVNEAIIDLAEKRLISSTTVFVNNEKLPIEGEFPKLKNVGIGLHLNLTEGSPVSDKHEVQSLIDKNGVFFSAPVLWLKFMFGLAKRDEIKNEITAQYSKLSGLIVPSHVDSHKHIHCFPFLGEYILRCLLELGVKKIRNPYPLFAQNRRYIFLKIFCKRKKWLNETRFFDFPEGIISLHEIDTLDHFISYDDRYVEIIAHPSVKNDKSYLNKKKVYELLLKQNEIKK